MKDTLPANLLMKRRQCTIVRSAACVLRRVDESTQYLYGKDVKILPPSTRFYVASTTTQNFNAVSWYLQYKYAVHFCHRSKKGSGIESHEPSAPQRTTDREHATRRCTMAIFSCDVLQVICHTRSHKERTPLQHKVKMR